jgi:hypothetical protein
MNLETKRKMKEQDRVLERRIRNAEKRAVRLRNYQRARGRALVRLAQQYPDQYKELLEQERLSDEANGKTWLDISGSTIADADIYLPTHRSGDTLRPEETYTNQQDEGNNRGEA